jgi:ribonucleotide monophosphatase NagD (HAD superfamily)
MIPIEGLEEIASDYDGMLIDQFGVLHDGTRLYPGSLDVLARLRALKIPIAVMTNSGKRTKANIARLSKIGIPRELYVDAVSSGEVAYERLKRAIVTAAVDDWIGANEQPDDITLVLARGQ